MNNRHKIHDDWYLGLVALISFNVGKLSGNLVTLIT